MTYQEVIERAVKQPSVLRDNARANGETQIFVRAVVGFADTASTPGHTRQLRWLHRKLTYLYVHGGELDIDLLDLGEYVDLLIDEVDLAHGDFTPSAFLRDYRAGLHDLN